MTAMKHAVTPEDLPSPQEMLEQTGLEAMQKMLRGETVGPPIAHLLNYDVTEVEEGRVVFVGTPLFSMANPMGTVHGGWYGTVLDSCMACAVMTKVPKGSTYTTLEYKINILRPIPLGMQVEAIGLAQHVGRSTGIANGEIRGVQDGKLYATGSTTCIVMKVA
ncbi:uncharacterized domain 1-containing protein [Thalassovita litoralis]|jgi:uncharacterized protein (TIGR00369 family)|uniref:Uncharacterized domain 1-containing protein n=2 Tax=Thalassovita litoralis TaxID=1010611 RepID=A0A521F9H2_9RHOB|nr:uncharacterized domain 1-containing protein [Thalassovita litoralis]